ncbi:MAG: radical SAM protein [Minisyncoccia bacterium]
MLNSKKLIRIAWWGLHFGEEPPFVLDKGAGTIFFSGCNLHCVYCQNYQISQLGIGQNYHLDEVVQMMLKLQNLGALNIDLVTPTIWAEPLKYIIKEAKKKGLKIPILWNSNAYEDVKMLKSLKGLVDIYLPDFKYGSSDLGLKYSGVKNYPLKAQKAIKEMLSQVGHLKLSPQGKALKGVLVRHLILPNNLENSFQVLDTLKKIDPQMDISLLTQYEPLYQAKKFKEINCNITNEEFEIVYHYFQTLGFKKGWYQEMGSSKNLVPDFTKSQPFC